MDSSGARACTWATTSSYRTWPAGDVRGCHARRVKRSSRSLPTGSGEILSPSTVRIDRVQKLPIYHASGVTHVWLVDPIQRTLEVLRSAEGGWVIVSVLTGRDFVQAEPFDAIPLELGALWPDVEDPADPH